MAAENIGSQTDSQKFAELEFDDLTNQMACENMAFLDPRRFVGRHADAAICQALHFSSASSRQGNSVDGFGFCRFQSSDHIGGIAAR